MNPLSLAPAAPVAVSLALLSAGGASADSKLIIRGAGYGHGIGMSQYGAYGMAREGFEYSAILRHYYTGTKLGVADPNRVVRVLLRTTPAATVTGAARAGDRVLDPAATYLVRRGPGDTVELLSASKRRLASFSGLLQMTGDTLRTGGRAYRGALELRAGSGGVNVVNAVSLEDYVRGVVALESPPNWPLEALKAQAVAARTYALTTSKGGNGFEQYADTRSQVYGGVGAETPSTNQAVADTGGHVVTYAGQPVVTYFFSTSGGRTEDVTNVWSGAKASPWLQSVEDPYDNLSPRHRWQPVRMSLSQAGKKLSGLVKGRFEAIEVLQRGRSPRIIAAEVVGSRGRTRVSGATLRARLGLYDTWAYFTTASANVEKPGEAPAPVLGPPTPVPGSPAGGAGMPGPATGGSQASPASLKASPVGVATIAGRWQPRPRGARVVLELRRGGSWTRVGRTTVGDNGAYRVSAPARGMYRVRAGSAIGPRVRVR